MESSRHTLRESHLYAWELSRLGNLRNLDAILEKALWAISCLAEDLPIVEGSESLRSLSWEPVFRGDGALVRLRIYFVIESLSVIELLSIRSERI